MARIPRYKHVVDALAADLRSGRWPAGTRLPTHRELAAREGIALVTATRVYAELEAMGLVSGEQGRGTFVRDLAVPPGQGIDQRALAVDAVDLSFNYPSVPGQADLLRQALRELATAGDLDALLHYQPHRGRAVDRASIARHLRRRSLTVSADQVLVVSGAQHGLAATVMATLQHGDIVAVDALTYPGFKVLAHALGLELAPLPVTPHGPDLEALERLCAQRPVRAIYAMPTLHNPLGWVLPTRVRKRLVAIARHHDLLIIEDAAYAFLAENCPPPLAALAPETTIYVSSLSKSVATGLRVGFVAAPEALVTGIERAIRATTWNTPALTTTIACRWLDDGTADSLEARKREDAATRQAIAREVLTGLVGHPASYFAWLPLAESARADRVAATLARQRISVSTAEPFATTSAVPQALRLALGSIGLPELRRTLAEVKRVVDEDAHA
ncbi:DNA-binding transcriptional regulator, MocR family, contains an aminotransferase domain [Amycolatopsis xylanica]|uniref:DNA-binding transcriptional regulator, MocR family, contains an aminotransferase domain n=1 Tax=Amycolatopsis xylanica TaxID=589385 RepID=A0A1H3LTK1_9PSEU|nr:PLP-dependent aminotransferase family protein [Amycolatopsis xylanica]SDY67693.1 DNA-binding transcriptional regulator, MocR family, contains an aminotransferase domain [Amycolatopsis xylanica]